jgi:Flp pilus assembly protein TadD
MNDYRPFLAYVGVVIAIAGAGSLALSRYNSKRTWLRVTIACTVTLFLAINGYATFQRNEVWKSDETLWHDVVQKSPGNGRGLMAYGIQLLNKGDYSGALTYFRRAQELTPNYYFLVINLAIAENATKQTEQAERHFRQALAMAPTYPDSYIYYARFLVAHGRVEEARPLLRRALELSPADVTARELWQAIEERGAQTEAQEANKLLLEGRVAEAMVRYEAALKIAPDAAPVLSNYAWALSTAPDPALRNGAKALDLAQRADQLAGGKNPVFIRTMAAAYAELGHFDEARLTAERARQFALEQQNSALADKLSKDLYYYQHSHPLHR